MLFVFDVRFGDAHKGTRHKLFSNTRVARDPAGVIRYPPKVGSLSLPVAKSTLNPAFRRTASDKIVSLVSVNVKVVPRVA